MSTIWPEPVRRLRAVWHARRARRPGERALARRWSRAAPARRYLALDLEMSGLDPRADEIVSFGWVAVDNGSIGLASARHLLVRGGTPGASARIHGILGTDREAGTSLRAALATLLVAADRRRLLLFAGGLDLAFLDAATRRELGLPFLAPALDVRELAHRRLGGAGAPGELGSLTALRSRFGLPAHRAHQALDDALATAELFLALRA